MSAYQMPIVQLNAGGLLAQLEAEIAECTEVQKCYANKVKKFMVTNEIWHLKELDYAWRIKFEKFLKNEVKPISYTVYLKAFDRLKQHTICAQLYLAGQEKYARPVYKNQVLFLPYHPNPEVINKFANAVKKQDLVWDFSIQAPVTMKQQIFQILHYIIENEKDGWFRKRKMMALKHLYEYCITADVENIDMLELKEINEILAQEDLIFHQRSGIVNYARKVLFLEASEINWNANVWYMERLHLQPERINPACPVDKISFLEVTDVDNRNLLKKYMRYNLGLTDLSLSSINSEFIQVRKFLAELQPNQNICTLTKEQILNNINKIEERDIKAASYNGAVKAQVHFLQFLKVRGDIRELPFDPDYYLKKTVKQHIDRSLEKEIEERILKNLYRFPEELRLIYLHLWTVGLRISEVCTLKGNAYYTQNRDTWIQVYQIKTRTYKRIPIPVALYKLMQVYIEKYQIQSEDYVFKNKNGGAYCSGTFLKKMRDNCQMCGIQRGDYLFCSHDFRHNVATWFYENQVSLQSIRDYLGHDYEEMTLQYIDYMPKKIDQENEEFFEQEENNLAAYIMR